MRSSAVHYKDTDPDMGGQAPGDVEERFCRVGVAEAQGIPGDVDGNGIIDGLDLTEVISSWTTGAAAAPEESGSSSPRTSDTDRSGHGNVKRRKGKVPRR